jgi:hypothetical protein
LLLANCFQQIAFSRLFLADRSRQTALADCSCKLHSADCFQRAVFSRLFSADCFQQTVFGSPSLERLVFKRLDFSDILSFQVSRLFRSLAFATGFSSQEDSFFRRIFFSGGFSF